MFRVVIHKENGTKNNNISLEEISNDLRNLDNEIQKLSLEMTDE